MKKKQIEIPNLADIPYSKALEIARALSGLTYEEIAEALGKGHETVRRYFTDPSYNPPSHLVPQICQVLGNYILIDWQAVHAGGYFFRLETGKAETSLDVQIAQLTNEFADVLNENGKARLDGDYNIEELSRIEKELMDLVRKGAQVRKLVRLQKAHRIQEVVR